MRVRAGTPIRFQNTLKGIPGFESDDDLDGIVEDDLNDGYYVRDLKGTPWLVLDMEILEVYEIH